MTVADDGVSIGEQELRRCTVCIDVGGNPRGTGFFVAPGHVVTCAHVVAVGDGSAPPDSIKLTALGGTAFDVEAVPDFLPDDDLAILRVTPANHPCVLLIPDLRMFDQFVTFGYPEDHREGVARPLTAEGMTGDER